MTESSDTQPVTSAPEEVSAPQIEPSLIPDPALPVGVKPLAMPSAETDAAIKKRLEYVLAGKEVHITFAGSKLTFRRWGLRQNLRMGSRVIKLVKTIRETLPDTKLLQDPAVLTQILSYVADDVLEIVGGSISSPFPTSDAAEKWLDENVANVEDLFDLAYIVYEQNLKGDALGKLTDGLEGLTKKMASLSMSSSKS